MTPPLSSLGCWSGAFYAFKLEHYFTPVVGDARGVGSFSLQSDDEDKGLSDVGVLKIEQRSSAHWAFSWLVIFSIKVSAVSTQINRGVHVLIGTLRANVKVQLSHHENGIYTKTDGRLRRDNLFWLRGPGPGWARPDIVTYCAILYVPYKCPF